MSTSLLFELLIVQIKIFCNFDFQLWDSTVCWLGKKLMCTNDAADIHHDLIVMLKLNCSDNLDIKVVPDPPAHVQKVTIFWYVKK